MPRRQPISTKQKKAQLQLKRAIKRGDVEAPEPTDSRRKTKGKGRPLRSAAGAGAGVSNAGDRTPSGVTTRKLESRFKRLEKEWLDHARFVASTTELPRPIPFEATVLDTNSFLREAGTPVTVTSKNESEKEETVGQSNEVKRDESNEKKPKVTMYAPKRPKWRYDQTKKEVEKNEEGLFSKWLREMDTIVEQWQAPPAMATAERDDGTKEEGTSSRETENSIIYKRSPTYFERNLEVWRQLWRVTEISQILLILLDCRAPVLHFPPSLQSYLQALRPTPKVILILTKVDLVTPSHVEAWTKYLSLQNPAARIVHVESYKKRRDPRSDGKDLNDAREKRMPLDPHIPPDSLQDLVSALKGAYNELLTPPPSFSDPKKWKPLVHNGINWDAVLRDPKCQTDENDGGGAAPDTTTIVRENGPRNNQSKEDGDAGDIEGIERMNGPAAQMPSSGTRASSLVDRESGHPVLSDHFQGPNEVDDRVLTIGLIGQPNVGKSSLLNALFGARRVRASKTPGKVLAGVLPISQMASIPSCVQFVCEKMPLEKILGLGHPSSLEKAVEDDKRTWRPGMKAGLESKEEISWTAMDVLTAYALSKGWKTAKAGRPDVNRAGNASLSGGENQGHAHAKRYNYSIEN
ncbi:hypothetical protein FRC17_006158, partial [Serendipita sp. 399]